MANAFSKEERVAFEDMMLGFDDACVLSKNISQYNPGDTMMERANDTIWRPQPYIAQAFSGTDMTSNFQDNTQLSVPATLNYKRSVPWYISASELRDQLQEGRIYESAKQKLSSIVNTAILTTASEQGTLVVKNTSAAAGFADVALADALMREQGVPSHDRNFAYSPRDYNDAAANLAGKTLQTPPNSKALKAYEEAYVGRVAGMETWKMDYANQLAAGTATSISVNGANQYYVPQATSGGANVDNRTQTLAITATGTLADGDCFTIAGVNAVNHITKQDTGQPKTFRVISGGGTGNITISPPIISAQGGSDAELQYQNVTATPANSAVITLLNTVAASINVFWQRDALEIVAGRYAVPANAGAAVMRARTSQGLEVVMQKQYDIDTMQTKMRCDILFGTVCKNPEMVGIELFSQT